VDLRDTGMADLLRLLVAAGFAAPVVTGFGAALAVQAAHPMPFDDYCRYALAWTTRDMVAVLVAVSLPFAIVGALRDRRPLRRVVVLRQANADRALLAGQVALVAASVALVFALGSADTHPVYLASPALLWLAASRGHRYAAIGVSFFGIGLTVASAMEPVPSDLTGLRLQIVGTALLTLAVGAQVDDRRRASLAHLRMTTALEMSEARYRTVLETAAEGVVILGADGTVDIANAAVERIFGRSRDDIEGTSLLALLPAPEGLDADDHLAALLTETTPGSSSGRRYVSGVRGDATTFPVHLSVARLEHHGQVTYTVILHDESDRREFEEQLEHQATHDALTDLPNRVLFDDRLQTGLERLRRQPGGIAVMLVDLDRFKAINDTLGHAAGDHVLQEAARRLRAAVRRSDTVARLGGDEFAVLCDPADERAAEATAQRVLHSLTQPFDGIPAELCPTASIGVRLAVDADDLPHDIVREADAALYRAKRAGKSCVRFFGPHRFDESEDALIDLRERRDGRALVVHYQPVRDVATGEIVAVEARARLRGADGTTLPPSRFVAGAERLGHIDHVGELVLRQACADVAALRPDHPTLRVSVNLSPRQLADAGTVAVVARALGDAGLSPEALTLGIRGTTAQIGGVARALADTGVRLALDDFGTDGSSLELLRVVPADEVKIGKSLVHGVARDGVEQDIVATLIGLAHRRRVRVVARGVETLEQADALTRLGCEQLQGFPDEGAVPFEELADLLGHGARSTPSSGSGGLGDRRPKRSAQS